MENTSNQDFLLEYTTWFSDRSLFKKDKRIRDIESVVKRHYSPSVVSAKQLENYLRDPSKNADKLQDVSQKMVNLNGILKEFINYKALILTQDHYIYPSDARKYKNKESIWKDEIKVASLLEKYNIKNLNRWVTKRLLQNGEVYIYKREGNDGILIQELPNKICKVSAVDEYGIKRYKIDVTKISDADIGFYPEEIQKAKNKKKSKDFDGKWYSVGDNGTAFILNQWETKGVPYYTNLFASLMNLDDAEKIEKDNNYVDNYKLLHQRIPTDNDGKMLMPADISKMYHQGVKAIAPEGVGVATTPMDIKPITLGDGKMKNQEYLQKLKTKIYDNAGISDDLFNGNSRTNEATILSAIIDSLVPIEIQGYLQDFFNYELNKSAKKGKWKVQFVHTTFYNRQKEIQLERENLAIYGSKKKYLATQGFTPIQVANLLYVEDLMDMEEFMKPMQTSHTISTKGRPRNSDNPDSGEISAEGD